MTQKYFIETYKAESITPQQKEQPTYAPMIEIASPFTVTNGALAFVANSITAAMLAANAVEVAEIKDAAVTAAKLASDAVTTVKILDANVTTAKIADLNVTAVKLAADAVETAKIKDSNVTTAKIADLNVTAGKLAADAVETAKIKDSNVTTAKIADLNVTTGKLAANAVTAAKTSGIPVLTVVGQPALSVDDRFVAAVAMKATAYTIANAASADGLARNILITHTAGDTADTLGDAVIVGTDINDEALTETIAVASGTTAAGTKCFKTVTSITTPDWVIDASEGTADTIKFGTGNLVGLPEVIAAQANVDLTTLGTAIVEATVTADGTDVSECTVDASTGTYDGTKKLRVWIHK